MAQKMGVTASPALLRDFDGSWQVTVTSGRIRWIALSCVLSLALGATSSASAHQAHRESEPVTTEAQAEDRVLPAAEPTSPSAAEGTEAPADEHLHEAAGSPPEPVSPVAWLGRLHPMAIHFPIALFLAALVAEALFAATRHDLFRHALRFCLWGGALGAVVAAPLGWSFAASGGTEEGWLLDAHRWTGTASAFLGMALLWVSERTERGNGGRRLLRGALALQALLIAGTGFLGGALLYGIDHLWRGA